MKRERLGIDRVVQLEFDFVSSYLPKFKDCSHEQRKRRTQELPKGASVLQDIHMVVRKKHKIRVKSASSDLPG
jgi:hypothetical protein